MKEREATAAAKAAEEHGASGNSDDSTKLGAGGKKVHVVQVRPKIYNDASCICNSSVLYVVL